MIAIRAVALLFALYLGLDARGQAPVQKAPAATPVAPGALVDVEAGKLYYEECGTGLDAVILVHDGIAHSAVWDDVWGTFCKRFHTIRYDRRGYGRTPAATANSPSISPCSIPRWSDSSYWWARSSADCRTPTISSIAA